jgi:hypothetical protein
MGPPAAGPSRPHKGSEDPEPDGCIGATASADQHRRRPAIECVAPATMSGAPRIRVSSCSAVGCVLASRVACFGYGHHIYAPSQPALGGDYHRCCEKNDHGAEDQESCCVRRRYHIVGELVVRHRSWRGRSQPAARRYRCGCRTTRIWRGRRRARRSRWRTRRVPISLSFTPLRPPPVATAPRPSGMWRISSVTARCWPRLHWHELGWLVNSAVLACFPNSTLDAASSSTSATRHSLYVAR